MHFEETLRMPLFYLVDSIDIAYEFHLSFDELVAEILPICLIQVNGRK